MAILTTLNAVFFRFVLASIPEL